MAVPVLRKTVTTRKNVVLRKQLNISERGNGVPCVSFALKPRSRLQTSMRRANPEAKASDEH